MASRPQLFAHRGARCVAPENTLPAFAAALEMDVDGIELDVQCSRDGRLVVIHNFQVDETTNGSGDVASFTLAELQLLDAGSHFSPEFAGTPIPTLEEVLNLVGTRCRVNVEIKSKDPRGGNQVEPLLALIQQRKLYDQVLISSFNPIALIKARWHDRHVALGLLHAPDEPFFLRETWTTPVVRPHAVHPHFSMIDDEYMEWARGHGLDVNTWTVNDGADAQRLAALGVDVIMSDVPDQIRTALSG